MFKIIRSVIYNEEPRLRAGWRLFGSFILLGIFFVAFSTPMAFLSLDFLYSPAGLALGAWVALAAITLAIYLSRHWFDRRSLTSLGVNWNAQGRRDLWVGIVIAAVMMTAIFLVEWAFGWISIENFGWQVQPLSQVLLDLLVFGLLYIAVGWYEELLMRGYLLRNIAEGLNVFWGVFISSMIFAIGHKDNQNASWIAVMWLVAAGIFFCYGFLSTRALWLPIGLHIGWNFFEGSIFGFPVSGLDTVGLIRQTPIGPEWLTGGAFGPEAGLILIVGLALGVTLIWLYTRRRPEKVGHLLEETTT